MAQWCDLGSVAMQKSQYGDNMALLGRGLPGLKSPARADGFPDRINSHLHATTAKFLVEGYDKHE